MLPVLDRKCPVVVLPDGALRLPTFSHRIALDMTGFYQKDAELNGLEYDIDKEERAIELLAQNIMRSGDAFSYAPMETPFIP